MTRLTTEDLRQIPSDLKSYDQDLKAVTGLGLLETALKTTAMSLEEFNRKAASIHLVAIVPTTMGQGFIPGFCQKIAKIVQHLGLPSKVTKSTDVAGLGEAVAGGSEILFCADDETFLALNLISNRVVENGMATGEVYAMALIEASGSPIDRPVGILGLGPVGRAAATCLYSKRIQVVVYDRNQKTQSNFLAAHPHVTGARSVAEVLDQTDLILEATTSSNIIKAKELNRHLILAAPGIPLGIDDPYSDKVSLIHDPLQLGVAAMLVKALG